MEKQIRRKLIDWNKKSGSDDERISKRLEGRALLADSATTQNDSRPQNTQTIPPRTTPLLKIRKRIREACDDEEEDEDENVYVPFFNISLIEDREHEYDDTNALPRSQQKATETLRITKEQEMAGKLNILMDTAMLAGKAGLSPKMTARDTRLLNTPDYNPSRLRRKAIKQKIEQPLQLKGEVREKELPQLTQAVNQLKKDFPLDSLKDLSPQDIIELDKQDDEEQVAKMILEKSGRKPKRKPQSLVELAKDIYEIEQQQPELTANKNKQKE